MPENLLRTRVTSLLVVSLTTVALAVGLAAPAAATSRRGRKIHHAVEVAINQKGDPYRYGAEGPERFDCSGLVQYSYGRAGLRLPRTSRGQARHARRIRRRKMRPGDLMFFHTRRGRVYHVAIFTGWSRAHNRLMVHAPSPGTRVRSSLPWTRRWHAGTLRRR
jgi:cell wall-associated NlpC family hydrolase